MLLEKDCFKFCIVSMYWKNNDDFGVEIKVGNGMVDMFVLFDVRYFVLF